MLTSRQKRELSEIATLLETASDGAIVFIGSSGPAIQRQAEKGLRQALKGKARIEKVGIPKDGSPLTFLRRPGQRLAGPVLFVYRLSDLVRAQQELGLSPIPALQELNAARESFYEKKIRVVFWLDLEALNKDLPRLAPDLWSFRSRSAEFVSEADQRAEIRRRVGQRLWGRDIGQRMEGLKKKIDRYAKERPEDRQGQIALRLELLPLVFHVGKKSEGKELAKYIAKVAKGLGDRLELGAALLRLGQACEEGIQQTESLRYLRQALRVYGEARRAATRKKDQERARKARQGEANALGNIALIYQDQGRLEEALSYHELALALHREICDRQGEADALGNIAVVYRDRGRLEEALSYHQQALGLDREIGYRRGEAQTLGAIAI
jgi:tetratricopeptide (TPR) repeat protein